MTKKTQYSAVAVASCEDCRQTHKDAKACDDKPFVVGRSVACEPSGNTHRFTRSLHCPVCCPDLQGAKEPELEDEYLVEATQQRDELLKQFIEIVPSLYEGLGAFLNNGWQWNPEDMRPTDAYQWKRLPRLCLIFAQFYAIKNALEFQASTNPLRPFWCITCRGEYPGRPYLLVECIDHDASPSDAYAWAKLFGAP